jgi:hypothetical protein
VDPGNRGEDDHRASEDEDEDSAGEDVNDGKHGHFCFTPPVCKPPVIKSVFTATKPNR